MGSPEADPETREVRQVPKRPNGVRQSAVHSLVRCRLRLVGTSEDWAGTSDSLALRITLVRGHPGAATPPGIFALSPQARMPRNAPETVKHLPPTASAVLEAGVPGDVTKGRAKDEGGAVRQGTGRNFLSSNFLSSVPRPRPARGRTETWSSSGGCPGRSDPGRARPPLPRVTGSRRSNVRSPRSLLSGAVCGQRGHRGVRSSPRWTNIQVTSRRTNPES